MKRKQHRRPTVVLKRCIVSSKGTKNRRIIGEGESATHEFSLHATKGYRASRIPGTLNQPAT